MVVPQQRSSGAHRRRLARPSGLRVIFENETLFNDVKKCEFSGQLVTIGDSASDDMEPCGAARDENCEFTCGEEHVLTARKRAALSRLLPAVSAWLVLRIPTRLAAAC